MNAQRASPTREWYYYNCICDPHVILNRLMLSITLYMCFIAPLITFDDTFGGMSVDSGKGVGELRSGPINVAGGSVAASNQSGPILPFYGTQFVPLSELSRVGDLGFNVVLSDFDYYESPSNWVAYLDAAWALNIRVIPWLWPEGWTLNRQTGVWTIDAKARLFIQTVATHPATFAIYALHEPYWMECETCGYTTAEQQALYQAIKQIAQVPVYSEINGFTFWAEASPDKAIAPGVCDYCQTAFYPFLTNGSYLRDELIAHMDLEIATLQRLAPTSRLIWTMQSFEYHADELIMPTSQEMWDYASLVFGRPEIAGAWWYVWNWDNELYSSDLKRHPELHPMVKRIADEIVAMRRGQIPPDRDTDHDGIPDADEIRSGTSLTDSNSYLRVTEMTPTNGHLVISWLSFPWKRYWVDVSSGNRGVVYSNLTGPIRASPSGLTSTVLTNVLGSTNSLTLRIRLAP